MADIVINKTDEEIKSGLETAIDRQVEIADLNRKRQVVLPKNIISNGVKLFEFSDISSWVVSSGDETSVSIDTAKSNPFSVNSLNINSTTSANNISLTKSTGINFQLTGDYIDIPMYRDAYSSADKWEIQFFNGTDLYSNYLTTGNIKDYLIAYGGNTWHKVRIPISSLTQVGTCLKTDNITKIKVLVFGAVLSASSKIGDVTMGSRSRPAIAFSFDDCNETDYTEAYRILNSYGFSGTSFIVSSIIGDKSGQNFPKLDLTQMQEMYNNGWTFGVHGHTWTNWLALTLAEAETSIKNCKNWLYDNGFKTALTHCAYPENKYNADIKNLLTKYGIRHARTTNLLLQQSPIEDFQEMKAYGIKATFAENKVLIDNCILEGGLLNLYGHELYNGQSLKITVDVFEETVQYIYDNYREYVTTIPQWCKDYETGAIV